MHELSIAEALIEQVSEELKRAGQTGAVKRVELAVGRLSGVHCDCLRFAFGLLAPGEVSLSTSNRNFRGRQGSTEASVYLCSAATAAASAIKGEITDPREV